MRSKWCPAIPPTLHCGFDLNNLFQGERMRGGEFHIDGDTDEHKGMLNKYGLWPNSP